MNEVDLEGGEQPVEELEGESEGEENKKVPFISDKRWQNPIHSGYGYKYTVVLGRAKWNRRFFVLDRDSGLWYFKNNETSKPRKDPVMIKDSAFWRSGSYEFCVQIEKYPKKFLLKLEDCKSAMEWISKLAIAGGINESNIHSVDEISPEISKVEVEKWSKNNVQKWLWFSHESVYDDEWKCFEIFKSMDGKKLLGTRESHLKEIGIRSFMQRKILARRIRYLSSRNCFDLRFHSVLKKLECLIDGKIGRVREEEKRQLVRCLSDPKSMCASYLSLDNLTEYFDSVLVEDDDDKVNLDFQPTSIVVKKRRRRRRRRNQSGNVENQNNDEDNEIKFHDYIVGCDGVGVQQEISSFSKSLFFPVRLLVSELSTSDRFKTCRRLLSSKYPNFPEFSSEFGVFRTAIVIGPFYLEWNPSSLIIPRRISGAFAQFVSDFDSAALIEKYSFDGITKKISEVVCKWNTSRNYSEKNELNKKNSIYGNCQHFVENLLSALGVTFSKKGSFGYVVNEIRKSGRSDMKFRPSPEFEKIYRESLIKKQQSSQNVKDREDGVIKFHSHLELDSFVEDVRLIDPISLRMDFPDEYRVLRSLDRAFWLRHLSFPEREKFKPLDLLLSKLNKNNDLADEVRFPTGCSFRDPRERNGMILLTKKK